MNALFYPLAFTQSQISDLVFGIIAALNIVDFAEEDGGDVDHALSVPYLRGMDAIVVTEARLVLRCHSKDLDIEQYSVTNNGNKGVFISTNEPSRLKKSKLVTATRRPQVRPPRMSSSAPPAKTAHCKQACRYSHPRLWESRPDVWPHTGRHERHRPR